MSKNSVFYAFDTCIYYNFKTALQQIFAFFAWFRLNHDFFNAIKCKLGAVVLDIE